MICAGSGQLGKMPDNSPSINWIPVNIDSSYVVDIALQSTLNQSFSERVHHLLNPHEISWREFLQHFQAAELKFRIKLYRQVIDLIQF
ncbi:unnamed protein product [Didymodactylos carnosus]|uniref:Uncharacterized protein n=1 Tax=Didymodactylos carnosus TaxID=1234261 RepID=A0A814LJN5_9BILA|nr:unnamed protein product [Didymodactylos carnosus]CAF1442079.1 unnamed protein product [Didymodactylos carnosus]CAF3834289.1 unnamed protein product [Didymodactylos carnosus]CAF4238183.1 unnamed protein product [Didymodactylos carnosus]